MAWLDIVNNNGFLKSLFGGQHPSSSIRMHEVQLHQDGPRMTFRFDLTDFPPQPPAKWREAGATTVQVVLMAVGIRTVTINGWSANNLGVLAVAASAGGVELQFTAPGCQLHTEVEHLRVDKVTAYCNAEP